MKVAVLISGLILFVGLPRAEAAVDLFECRSKLVDLKTNSTSESVGNVSGNRLATPINSSTGLPYPPNVAVTTGELKLGLAVEGEVMSYSVNMVIHYGFAERGAGETRQYVCNQTSLRSCKKDSAGKRGTCTVSDDICMQYPDPFDAKYGWNMTTSWQGLPVFNEQLLRPLDTVVPVDAHDPNGARVTVSCKFLGTYR